MKKLLLSALPQSLVSLRDELSVPIHIYLHVPNVNLADPCVAGISVGITKAGGGLTRRILFVFFVLGVLMMANIATSNENSELFAELLYSKDRSMSSVATRVAYFKETFVVGGLDFNADGTQLAVNALFDGRDVDIWQWRGNSHVAHVLHKEAAAGGGNAVRYSPDGMLLAVGHVGVKTQSGMRIIRVWDTQTDSVVHDITTLEGGSGEMSIAFSPDGKFLMRTEESGGSPGNYVVVVRTDTWEPVWGLPTLPLISQTLAVSPNGEFIAVAGYSSIMPNGPPSLRNIPQILIVNLANRQIIRTIDRAFPEDNSIQTLAWSPDGAALAAGAIVGGSFAGPDAVKIFDPASGKELSGEHGESADVNGLAYSADGRYLIEGWINGTVRIWDGGHKDLLQSIPADLHFHTVLCVSRDSKLLAIGDGKVITIWELK